MDKFAHLLQMQGLSENIIYGGLDDKKIKLKFQGAPELVA